jgi:hypothetical protein
MPAPEQWGPLWGIGGAGQLNYASALPVSPDVSAAASVNGAGVGRDLSLPLPEVFPLPDAQLFNSELQQTTNAPQTLFSLPFTPAVVFLAGYYAVVTSFTIYIQNMLATTNVLFTLLYNGTPVQGYNGLTIFPGASPRVANTFDAPIRFTGAGTLTVTIQNIDGGTYLVGAAVSGWQWPITSDRRWKNSGPVDAG